MGCRLAYLRASPVNRSEARLGVSQGGRSGTGSRQCGQSKLGARIASALVRSGDAGLRLAHRRPSAANETESEARLGVIQGGLIFSYDHLTGGRLSA
jgi:hypothetical protein